MDYFLTGDIDHFYCAIVRSRKQFRVFFDKADVSDYFMVVFKENTSILSGIACDDDLAIVVTGSYPL